MATITEKMVRDWAANSPVISDIMAMRETFWVNDQLLPFEQASAPLR